MTALVFGVHYRWVPPPAVFDQINLSDQLRSDLVALQLQYDEDLRSIWSSFPKVASAEAELRVAEQAAHAALVEVKAERVRQRRRNITGPAAEQLAVARTQLKDARQLRRDAITEVKSVATQQRQLRSKQLQADRRQLYQKYCQPTEGPALYWATFNVVLRHHQKTVKWIARQRALGRPAALRHRPPDGSGMIAVQLARREGQPARTPGVLADPAGKFKNVLFVPWPSEEVWDAFTRSQQRAAGRFAVRMRCGTLDKSPTWIDIPVQAHRVFPAKADIVGAQLHVMRWPGGIRAKLSVCAYVDEPRRRTTGPTLALHLGWRKAKSGIIVATWRSTQPLRISDDLRSVAQAATPMSGQIVLPGRITDAVLRADETRSQRARLLNTIRAELCQWLGEHGPVPDPDRIGNMLTSEAVIRWKTRDRFAALALAWRATPPPHGQHIAAALEAWRRTDKKLWIGPDFGQRRHAIAARDDLYRRVAALIASQSETVVIDDMDLTKLARSTNRTEVPPVLQAQAGQRRQVASPARLRLAVIRAATREGCCVIKLAARGLSSIHVECGFSNPSDARDETGRVPCAGCGAVYDPDENAVALMLRRARDETDRPRPGYRTRNRPEAK